MVGIESHGPLSESPLWLMLQIGERWRLFRDVAEVGDERNSLLACYLGCGREREGEECATEDGVVILEILFLRLTDNLLGFDVVEKSDKTLHAPFPTIAVGIGDTIYIIWQLNRLTRCLGEYVKLPSLLQEVVAEKSHSWQVCRRCEHVANHEETFSRTHILRIDYPQYLTMVLRIDSN